MMPDSGAVTQVNQRRLCVEPVQAGLTNDPSVARNTGIRILVVEDHLDSIRPMVRLLELNGHTVRTATGVEEALKVASAESFDLIISDFGLPDGNGHDLIRQVRAKSPPVRGICLSGYNAPDDIAAARQAGFDAHLTKPVNFDKLRALIDQMAATRR